MIDLRDPFTKEEILRAVARVNREVEEFFVAFSLAEFFTPLAGAWSPAENLAHLVKSVRPITMALRLPRPFLRLGFGAPRYVSRRYSEIQKTYQGKLAEGAKAPRQFLPHGAHAPIRSAQMRLKILRDWETVGAKLLATIHPWPESDLDRCLLPHPLLGKLTVREMIFFTLYHNLHHVQNVQRRRAAA